MKQSGQKPVFLFAKKAAFSALLAIPVLLPGVGVTAPCNIPSFPQLPEGNTGIASRYPGDGGIAKDSAVIFADDFESYSSASGLSANWNGGVYHDVSISTAGEKVFAGKQAVEFFLPKQSAEWSNTVARELNRNQELEVLFLRYYTKFDQSFDISGSCHNGGGMSAHYYINGQATPGIPANGYNKFLATFESWRGTGTDTAPGLLNVYIYHPEQRSEWGDHFYPNGEVMPNTSIPGNFGDEFVSRPNIRCRLGQWYCCELMVKANTVGLRDGRIACWLDGALIADFTNLRLRDVDSLKINRFDLSFHAGSNTTHETWKWYDNVVAARSYIGPLSSPGSVRFKTDKGISQHGVTVSNMTISFFLAQPSPVAVDIYTAQGATIRKCISRAFAAGNHRICWDGRNESGIAVARGIYIARIRTPDNVLTAKMAVAH
jgi:hypothetical protein